MKNGEDSGRQQEEKILLPALSFKKGQQASTGTLITIFRMGAGESPV